MAQRANGTFIHFFREISQVMSLQFNFSLSQNGDVFHKSTTTLDQRE